MTITSVQLVAAICAITTTGPVNDGPRSSAMKMEIIGCLICNEQGKPCPLPPDFKKAIDDAKAQIKPPATARKN